MPTVAARYVALAERVAARLGSPRIQALHLPPAHAATAKDADFLAVELEDGSFGFSYAPVDTVDPSMPWPSDAGALVGMEASVLARRYAAEDPDARAVGFASINALSQCLFTRAKWMPADAGDSLGEIEPKRGEHIGMIGLFRPLVARVNEAGARLTVLELKPELAGEHEGFRVTLDPADLASCDKVVSTCAVMLNDTLDDVLAACRHARYFAMIGPTAGCLPDPLFARGVYAIGGRRVIDARGFRDAFRRGEKWGSFATKYVITRQAYPGVDALLDKAG